MYLEFCSWDDSRLLVLSHRVYDTCSRQLLMSPSWLILKHWLLLWITKDSTHTAAVVSALSASQQEGPGCVWNSMFSPYSHKFSPGTLVSSELSLGVNASVYGCAIVTCPGYTLSYTTSGQVNSSGKSPVLREVRPRPRLSQRLNNTTHSFLTDNYCRCHKFWFLKAAKKCFTLRLDKGLWGWWKKSQRSTYFSPPTRQ